MSESLDSVVRDLTNLSGLRLIRYNLFMAGGAFLASTLLAYATPEIYTAMKSNPDMSAFGSVYTKALLESAKIAMPIVGICYLKSAYSTAKQVVKSS
jgi:hypothetical protein